MIRKGVRISGGRFRGRNLPVPSSARPTSGRLREALLDIWQSRVQGARFLELFAGTGAVGLEALSRGAAFVAFVDDDRESVDRLRRICADLAPDATSVCRANLPSQVDRVRQSVGDEYDLIFVDPPYAFSEYEALLASVEAMLNEGGEVAAEHSARAELPDRAGGLVRATVRTYGESRISFYRAG